MSYVDDETSVHDGRPIELYKFVNPIRSYCYTSYHRTIEYNGDVYEAIPLKRSSFTGGSTQDPPNLDIEMPVNKEVVQDHAFQIAPRSLDLTIFRRHGEAGETVVYWTGHVASVSAKNRTAKLRVPSTFASRMSQSIPNIYYQSQCNHPLYGTRCGVLRSEFVVETTAVSYSGGAFIAVGSVGGEADGHFNAGEIVRVADGERRLITSQQGVSLSLNYPFREMNPGDAVEIYAGCDHTIDTCKAKFDNVVNFGGHPYIPTINPFKTKLS